jgi:ABC-type enterochelin transport system substrate-binding protein
MGKILDPTSLHNTTAVQKNNVIHSTPVFWVLSPPGLNRRTYGGRIGWN